MFTPADFTSLHLLYSEPDLERTGALGAKYGDSKRKELALREQFESLEVEGKFAEAEKVQQALHALIAAREYGSFLQAISLAERLRNMRNSEFNFSPQVALSELPDVLRSQNGLIQQVFGERFSEFERYRSALQNGDQATKKIITHSLLGFIPQDQYLIEFDDEQMVFLLSDTDYSRVRYNFTQAGDEGQEIEDVWLQMSHDKRAAYLTNDSSAGTAFWKQGITLYRLSTGLSRNDVLSHERQHHSDGLVTQALGEAHCYGRNSTALKLERFFWTETLALLSQDIAGGLPFPALDFFGDHYDPLVRFPDDEGWKNPREIRIYEELRRSGQQVRSDIHAIMRRLDELQQVERSQLSEDDTAQFNHIGDRYRDLKYGIVSYLQLRGLSAVDHLEALLNLEFHGSFGRVDQLPRDLSRTVQEHAIRAIDGNASISFSLSDFYADVIIQDVRARPIAELNVIYYSGSYFFRALQPGLRMVTARDGAVKEVSQVQYTKISAGTKVEFIIDEQALNIGFEAVE